MTALTARAAACRASEPPFGPATLIFLPLTDTDCTGARRHDEGNHLRDGHAETLPDPRTRRGGDLRVRGARAGGAAAGGQPVDGAVAVVGLLGGRRRGYA
jgi:hypothetical protein